MMTIPESPIVPPKDTQNSERCYHHWVIEPARGPLSTGKCQICGEVREFTNSIRKHGWS